MTTPCLADIPDPRLTLQTTTDGQHPLHSEFDLRVRIAEQQASHKNLSELCQPPAEAMGGADHSPLPALGEPPLGPYFAPTSSAPVDNSLTITPEMAEALYPVLARLQAATSPYAT